jgi:AmmeMemoRadiSam system protein A
MKFSSKEDLAKFSIEYFFSHGSIPRIEKGEFAEELRQKGACFVSVYIDDKLRGCIGDYEVFEPLYLNIIKNAVKAAFSDFRFPSIQKDELPHLKTEVSILTTPQEFKPENIDHLLTFLEKNKPGVIIEQGGKKALFLPQVWQKLPKPADFLTHLCLKAALPPTSWQEKDTKYRIFSISQVLR